MANKRYKLKKEQLKPLATGYDGCIASDYITVDGRKVGFMYREETDREYDSGWRFLSGFEDDTYLENADNFSVHDVNTIANYDPDIIPFLDLPAGTEVERKSPSSPLEVVEGE